MKPFCGFSVVSALVLLIFVQTTTTSCVKDKTLYDTVTVTKTDTLQKKDTAVSFTLLTAHPWKLYEIRGVTNNVPYYYLRGGSANTLNYDNEYISFNADKTGVYFDPSGTLSSLVWDFASDSTKIVYTVNFPGTPTVINWEHLAYKNGMIEYDEYFHQGSTVYSHSHGIRMPK